jgi:hypothetical protein
VRVRGVGEQVADIELQAVEHDASGQGVTVCVQPVRCIPDQDVAYANPIPVQGGRLVNHAGDRAREVVVAGLVQVW